MADTSFDEEIQLLIEQLKQLNAQFNEGIKKDGTFAESKELYLRIKAGNAKLAAFLQSGILPDAKD